MLLGTLCQLIEESLNLGGGVGRDAFGYAKPRRARYEKLGIGLVYGPISNMGPLIWGKNQVSSRPFDY